MASTVNADLEAAVNKLLNEVMSDPNASITDKTKVIDRALKLEAIKQRVGPEFGGMFSDDENDEREGVL